jgi:RNA polymerase sigma factor (sigma-70 family)
MSDSPLTDKQRIEISNLYKENRDRLVGWLIARGMDVNDAVDIYQQSVLAVTERLVKNGIDYFRNGLAAYLFSVMKYMYYFEMKKKGSISVDPIEHDLVLNLHEEMVDFIKEPDDLTLQLRHKMKELDSKSYLLLRLFYYEGKSMREIAKAMGYGTEQVAKTTKYRILNKLRKMMDYTEAG